MASGGNELARLRQGLAEIRRATAHDDQSPIGPEWVPKQNAHAFLRSDDDLSHSMAVAFCRATGTPSQLVDLGYVFALEQVRNCVAQMRTADVAICVEAVEAKHTALHQIDPCRRAAGGHRLHDRGQEGLQISGRIRRYVLGVVAALAELDGGPLEGGGQRFAAALAP